MSDVNQVLSRMMTAFDVKKYKDLAYKLGVSPNTVDVWKRRGAVPEKNILKCVNLTGVSLDWLKNGGENKSVTGLQQKTVQIPMLKIDAGAGSGVHNFEPQQTIISLNPAYFPSVHAGKSAVVEIMGDSMEPDLLDGDFIIISPVASDRITEDGIYAIRIDGMIKVKNLHFRLDGTIDIISSNPKYATEHYDPHTSQVDFEILGRKELRITNR